jgi:hypothetical protein
MKVAVRRASAYQCEGRATFVPMSKHHDKNIWGMRGRTSCNINLGTRRKIVVSFTLWPLCPEEMTSNIH